MKNTLITLFTIILLAISSVALAAEFSLGDILLATFPLLVAVRDDKVSEIKRLLDEGADVNDEEKGGLTALILAAFKGRGEIVKLLLDNRAKVDHKNKHGFTALMMAAHECHNEVAKLLLEYKANPDIRGNSGENSWDLAKDKPIMLAIFKKHLDDTVAGNISAGDYLKKHLK